MSLKLEQLKWPYINEELQHLSSLANWWKHFCSNLPLSESWMFWSKITWSHLYILMILTEIIKLTEPWKASNITHKWPKVNQQNSNKRLTNAKWSYRAHSHGYPRRNEPQMKQILPTVCGRIFMAINQFYHPIEILNVNYTLI